MSKKGQPTAPKIVLASEAASAAAAPREESPSANKLTPAVFRPMTVAPEFYSEYDELQKHFPIFNGTKRFVWIQEDKTARAKPANGSKRFHVYLLINGENDKNRVKMIRAWGRSAIAEGILLSASWNAQNCWLVVSSRKTLAELNTHVREFWKQYDKEHEIDQEGFPKEETATAERRTEAADSGSGGDKKRRKSSDQK